ncbi:MAG TPA: DNA polymerase IV, partial [bacterium]|nr:DNA polymerase IV [bacterium]
SVEQRDNPALRGLPVVVGGSPAGRGVVAAASYEARRYGIHSAMPCARAYRLCPDALFVPPRFDQYRAVSAQIRAVFHRYTDLVEPLSLDEAYLDVTVNHVGNPSATRIAQAIKADIHRETHLTASAGVAPNKFLAKIASDEKKPNGLFVIRPQDVAGFVAGLPLRKVPGVGEATMRIFESMGVQTCGELAGVALAELTHRFGKRGPWFYRLARGIDERPVEPHRERKSVSIEDTFAEDHAEPDWLLARLKELCAALHERLRKSGVKGRTVTLKLRTSDFQIHTRSRTLPAVTDDAGDLYREAAALYHASGLIGHKLRLLGVGLHQLDTPEIDPLAELQLELPWAGEA